MSATLTSTMPSGSSPENLSLSNSLTSSMSVYDTCRPGTCQPAQRLPGRRTPVQPG